VSLNFYTENGDVAERGWEEADQANQADAAFLMARVRRVAISEENQFWEANPDLYDFNTRLWLFARGDYEIFYTLHPFALPAQRDVIILGVADRAKHHRVVAQMERRSALTHTGKAIWPRPEHFDPIRGAAMMRSGELQEQWNNRSTSPSATRRRGAEDELTAADEIGPEPLLPPKLPRKPI